MMPRDSRDRKNIYERILKEGKSLHAAVEGESLKSASDILKIEELFQITGIINECLNPKEIVHDLVRDPIRSRELCENNLKTTYSARKLE